jgi:hypothetical protein
MWRRSKVSLPHFHSARPSEVDDELFNSEGWGGHHPSLSDISDREAEITKWENEIALRKMLKIVWVSSLTIMAAGSAVAAYQQRFLLMTVLLSVLFMEFFLGALVRAMSEPWRPRDLEIVPHSQVENECYLLGGLPVDDFSAWSMCPSCLYVDAHMISYIDEDHVVRVCTLCGRQWEEQ